MHSYFHVDTLCFFYGWTTCFGRVPPHERGFTITLGRTPLHEWSTRRWELYLTIHNTHKRQISMPLPGFEHAIPTSHTLDRAATGIGKHYTYIRYSATAMFHTAWWLREIFSAPHNTALHVRKTPNYTTVGVYVLQYLVVNRIVVKRVLFKWFKMR
jgi:hypothetical protein